MQKKNISKRINARKIWENAYGVIPDGYELHHKIPIYAGGTNELENLEILLPEDHAKAHLELYKKYGNYRDLCAYYMIGYNFTQAHMITCSVAGKIGGRKVFREKIGIFRDYEERRIWASMGGKIGGKKQKELGLGIHISKSNPELHKKWASMGGKKSGQFQNKKFQSDMGKRGGVKNKGFRWYNDGTKTYKYTKRQQQEQPFNIFLEENRQFSKGRIIKNEN